MLDLGEEGGAVRAERVAGAGLDQAFERLAAHRPQIDALAQVVERGEAPALASRVEDRPHRGLADPFDRGEAETDAFRGRCSRRPAGDARGGRREIHVGLVHVGPEHGDAEALRLGDELRELRQVGLVVRHHRAEELHRVVRLEVGGLVGDDGVGGGVGFVEPVAGELLEQVEHLVRLGRADLVLLGAALHEGLALQDHLLELLLAHRAAQEVRAAERVAGEDLGRLHHLLLVDEHAVGLAGDRLEERMRILDDLLAVAALDEVGDEVHRPRPVERDERGDVLDAGDLELLAEVAHAAGFQLEHPERLRVVEQLVGLGVVERQGLEVEHSAGGALHELHGVAEDGERLQPEEIHLQQAEVADRAHRVLGDDAAVVVLLQRQEVDERLGADDDAGRVDAGAAGLVLEQERVVDELPGHLLGIVGRLEVRVLLQRVLQAPLHVGDHLGEAVALAEAEAHHASDVAQDRFRAHRAEGDDLGDGVAAVLLADVLDHLRAPVVREVDVDVGRADAFGVEEAFEEQPVAQRIDVRDLQQVGDHRSGSGSARHAGDAAVAAPADEIADDQEVRDVARLLDDPEFQVEAVEDGLDRRLDPRIRRIQHQRIGTRWNRDRRSPTLRFQRSRDRCDGILEAFRLVGTRTGPVRLGHLHRFRCPGPVNDNRRRITSRFRRKQERQPLRLLDPVHDDGLALDMGVDRVAFLQAVAEQLPEVALAGPGLGRLEDRVVLGAFAVLDLEVALLGHLDRVQHGLGDLGEERLHLVRRAEEELGLLVAHALGVAELGLGTEADQAIVGLPVALLDVVDVVRCDRLEPELLGPRNQRAVELGLLRDAVVLQLEVVVLRTERLLEPIDGVAGLLLVALEDMLGKLAGEAAGERDEAAGMFREQLFVDSRLVIETLEVRRGDEADEVVVAHVVLREQHQMVVDVAHAGARLLFQPAAGGDVDLAADDGLDARLLSRVVELDGAEHVPVVGHRERRELEGGGLGHQAVQAARRVEQRILGVQVQMDEVGHGGRKDRSGGDGVEVRLRGSAPMPRTELAGPAPIRPWKAKSPARGGALSGSDTTSVEALDGLAFLAGDHLVVDPSVGLLHAVAEPGRGFPTEHFLDERVVGVAAVHALRGLQVVGALELDAGDVLDDVDELVDGDELAAADVDGFDEIAVGEHLRALEAVVDVHERTGLVAVAPDLDVVRPGELGGDDLAAGRGGGLLAAAVVGAERSVDVVVAGDTGPDAVVLAEVAAHALAEELLPAVTVLGQRGVGVLLLERGDVRVALLVAVVDAGAGGVEVALDAEVLGGLEQVRVDEHREHAQGLVVLDEAHAAHVGREVEDRVGALDGGVAVALEVEIEDEVLDVGEPLVPTGLGFAVDGADAGEPLAPEIGDEVPADETAAATDNYEVILHFLLFRV